MAREFADQLSLDTGCGYQAPIPGRDGYRAACTCGWRSDREYPTKRAAQGANASHRRYSYRGEE